MLTGAALEEARTDPPALVLQSSSMTVVSYYDVFPFGLGLDLAGGSLLVQGLFTRPREFARRMVEGRNTFSRFNVRAAEDRADVVGVAVLVAGFATQGLGYVLYIGGAMSKTHGGAARLAALGLLLVGFLVGFVGGRATRTRRVRRYLIELARYDMAGVRHAHPWNNELQLYAALLGQRHDPTEYAGAELQGEAQRYWKLRWVRTMANAD